MDYTMMDVFFSKMNLMIYVPSGDPRCHSYTHSERAGQSLEPMGYSVHFFPLGHQTLLYASLRKVKQTLGQIGSTGLWSSQECWQCSSSYKRNSQVQVAGVGQVAGVSRLGQHQWWP